MKLSRKESMLWSGWVSGWGLSTAAFSFWSSDGLECYIGVATETRWEQQFNISRWSDKSYFWRCEVTSRCRFLVQERDETPNRFYASINFWILRQNVSCRFLFSNVSLTESVLSLLFPFIEHILDEQKKKNKYEKNKLMWTGLLYPEVHYVLPSSAKENVGYFTNESWSDFKKNV